MPATETSFPAWKLMVGGAVAAGAAYFLYIVLTEDEDESTIALDPNPPRAAASTGTTEILPTQSQPVSPQAETKSKGVPVAVAVAGAGAVSKMDCAANGDSSLDVAGAPSPVARFRMRDNTPVAQGTKELPTGAPMCLYGLKIVITGIMVSTPRPELKDLIEQYGAEVVLSINRKTDYACVGREAGPKKLLLIEKYKTKVLDEDGLFHLIATSAWSGRLRHVCKPPSDGYGDEWGGGTYESSPSLAVDVPWRKHFHSKRPTEPKARPQGRNPGGAPQVRANLDFTSAHAAKAAWGVAKAAQRARAQALDGDARKTDPQLRELRQIAGQLKVHYHGMDEHEKYAGYIAGARAQRPVEIRTPFLPRICSRTLVDCPPPAFDGGATHAISDLSMR